MENKSIMHTFVNIKDRKTLILDGILNIERFDENEVLLKTREGKIEIEGKNLKIESLTKEEGIITVCGRIEGVFYEKEKEQISGFWKRIFG